MINLDLRTAGVRQYVARLNLTGGMVVSLFYQGRGGGENEDDDDDEDDDAAPPPSMGTAGELVDVLRAYGQRVPWELLALGPPPPSWIRHRRGGGTTTTSTAKEAKEATRGGGRVGAATSRTMAIAGGRIRRGRTRPRRGRTTTTATAPPRARLI